VKQTVVQKARTYLPQHAHQLSHLTTVAKGSVSLWRDGVFDGEFTAPHGLYIEAGVQHLFMTLEDDTVLYCIHSLATPDALRVLKEHEIV